MLAKPGLAIDKRMLAHLEALYVVGANPAKRYLYNPGSSFLVVQDMFLTETAKAADVILPASGQYEKSGTVTNTFGEIQQLKKGLLVNGAKTDLEILNLVARAMGFELGFAAAAEVFEEIRSTVRGYNVSMPSLLTGAALPVVTLNGAVPHESRPGLIFSANDTLFTSGSLGRYCTAIQAVAEAKTRKNPEEIGK